MTAEDLLAFLRERLDDDENTARYAIQAGGDGQWTEPASGVVDLSQGPDAGLEGLLAIDDHRISRHIVHYNPARVLAEVASKRAIIDELWAELRYASDPVTVESCDEDSAVLAQRALLLLALPYATHPGYQEGWKPQ